MAIIKLQNYNYKIIIKKLQLQNYKIKISKLQLYNYKIAKSRNEGITVTKLQLHNSTDKIALTAAHCACICAGLKASHGSQDSR